MQLLQFEQKKSSQSENHQLIDGERIEPYRHSFDYH